jgi:predicted TPR repeat methyltransferase
LTNEGTEATHGDPNYARKIFDAMANIFEDRLVSVLKYNAPYLLEEEITKIIEAGSPRLLPSFGSFRILDLGCGSGLCAKAFHRYVSYSVVQGRNSSDLESAGDILRSVVASEGPVFVGIDVSEKMVISIFTCYIS